eukprot:TRINITY_DN37212_c0_g1_i1.p1 TRINITY_DN37212_c0_g1~~TRINITY_DN37212_c0_g1_i1.p1  ORF type:complete len:1105 (+),score=203.26 TRINITY_DN37212_c0_g1_i1:100-3414(+)
MDWLLESRARPLTFLQAWSSNSPNGASRGRDSHGNPTSHHASTSGPYDRADTKASSRNTNGLGRAGNEFRRETPLESNAVAEARCWLARASFGMIGQSFEKDTDTLQVSWSGASAPLSFGSDAERQHGIGSAAHTVGLSTSSLVVATGGTAEPQGGQVSANLACPQSRGIEKTVLESCPFPASRSLRSLPNGENPNLSCNRQRPARFSGARACAERLEDGLLHVMGTSSERHPLSGGKRAFCKDGILNGIARPLDKLLESLPRLPEREAVALGMDPSGAASAAAAMAVRWRLLENQISEIQAFVSSEKSKESIEQAMKKGPEGDATIAIEFVVEEALRPVKKIKKSRVTAPQTPPSKRTSSGTHGDAVGDASQTGESRGGSCLTASQTEVSGGVAASAGSNSDVGGSLSVGFLEARSDDGLPIGEGRSGGGAGSICGSATVSDGGTNIFSHSSSSSGPVVGNSGGSSRGGDIFGVSVSRGGAASATGGIFSASASESKARVDGGISNKSPLDANACSVSIGATLEAEAGSIFDKITSGSEASIAVAQSASEGKSSGIFGGAAPKTNADSIVWGAASKTKLGGVVEGISPEANATSILGVPGSDGKSCGIFGGVAPGATEAKLGEVVKGTALEAKATTIFGVPASREKPCSIFGMDVPTVKLDSIVDGRVAEKSDGTIGGLAADVEADRIFGGAAVAPVEKSGGIFGGATPGTKLGDIFEKAVPETKLGCVFGGISAEAKVGGIFGGPAPGPKGGSIFAEATPQAKAGNFIGGAAPEAKSGTIFGSSAPEAKAASIFGGEPASVAKPRGIFGGAGPDPQVGGIFGGALPQAQAGSSIGGATPEAKQVSNPGVCAPEAKVASIFGGESACVAKLGGMFGGAALEAKSGSIFGDATPAPGIFRQAAPETTTTSVFGGAQPKATVDIVSGAAAPEAKSPGMFGGAASEVKPGGIFGGALSTPSPGSIFTFGGGTSAMKPAAKAGDLFGGSAPVTSPAAPIFGATLAAAAPQPISSPFGPGGAAIFGVPTGGGTAPGSIAAAGIFGAPPAGGSLPASSPSGSGSASIFGGAATGFKPSKGAEGRRFLRARRTLQPKGPASTTTSTGMFG